jgi:hypothetical protein
MPSTARTSAFDDSSSSLNARRPPINDLHLVEEFHLSFYAPSRMSPRRVLEGRRRLGALSFRRKLRRLVAGTIRNVRELEGFSFKISW